MNASNNFSFYTRAETKQFEFRVGDFPRDEYRVVKEVEGKLYASLPNPESTVDAVWPFNGAVEIEPKSAIYRIDINVDDGSGLTATYVGRASSMHARVKVYALMVRRLLALYSGHKVRIDKDPFRYVHYAMARGIEEKRTVVFTYFLVDPPRESWELERLELLEISHLVKSYKSLEDVTRCLNNMPTLTRSGFQLPEGRWRSVQDRLPLKGRSRVAWAHCAHAA